MFLVAYLSLLGCVANDESTQLLETFRSEFVAISPGKQEFPAQFLMGRDEGPNRNEQPAHNVVIDYEFEIARYEVPQNLWEAVMGENPSRWRGSRNSVELLSYEDAVQFCSRATIAMRRADLIRSDQVIRLPSEAEWEYATRAGTSTIYSFGDQVEQLDQYAWHTGNAAGNDPPVGAKKPNPWGLYDVHGYLWEWCLDAAHSDYQGAPANGSPWMSHDKTPARVLRGGSWKDPADKLTSTYRRIAPAGTRDDAVGLRCVLAQVEPNRANAATPSPAGTEFRPTAADRIVPADSRLEMVWTGGQFTEGPALAPDGSIVFSDIGNTIYRFDPRTNETTEFRANSGRSNGLMFDAKGRLFACEGANTGGGRRISITERDGSVRTLADSYQGKRFNSPNDLALDGRGRVYFTDPRYVGDEPRELDFEAVFRVDPDGSVSIATRDVEKPNGILVSIDGRRIYVADNNPQENRRGNRQLLVFDVDGDGRLSNKRVLFDFLDGRGIDGMTLDAQGNVYATAGRDQQAGIYVFGPDGEHLAFFETPGAPTNCVFGGGDEIKTLYITAPGPVPSDAAQPRPYALYRIQLSNPGHHLVRLDQQEP